MTLTCTANVGGLTRRRVTTSFLAKLMNEKFAQEQFRNKSKFGKLILILIIWVKRKRKGDVLKKYRDISL